MEEETLKVEVLSYRAWKVENEDEYIVWLDDKGRYHCSCPYYSRKPRLCIHIKAVQGEGELV